MKRILSFLMALTLVFSMFPNVFADTEPTAAEPSTEEPAVVKETTVPEQSADLVEQTEYVATSGDYTYDVSNGEATITGYTGEGGDINIPSILGGYSVTTISHFAFEDCTGLTSVNIPDSVTIIGNSAFAGCTSLLSVELPNCVTNIGYGAFYNCSSLIYNTYDNGKYLGNNSNPYLVLIAATSTSIDTCNVNSNTRIIYRSAFYNCAKLTSITIPKSVKSIEDYAFYYCTRLPTVNIPDSVTTIGAYAFYNCDGLTSVTIPDSVFTIGEHVFSNCENLSSVTIGNGVTTIGDFAFYYCHRLASVTIGNSVATIGRCAFSSWGGIDYVYITDVAAWCNISFADSSSNPLHKAASLYVNNVLCTDLIIPEGVTTIEKWAFVCCNSLTSIIIPDSVTTIGESAFSTCNNLISVTIPDCMTAIGYGAFGTCQKLRDVYITDVAAWCNISFADSSSNPLYNGASLYVNGAICTELVIPDDVIHISNYAFTKCASFISVAIPDSVITIGDYEFWDCNRLTSVVIPNSVTSIGCDAFSDCEELNIYGFTGSYAQQYAEVNSIPFVDLQACNGEETFATLQEALDAYEGGTIQLLADVGSVTVNKNAVVDLNGFNIASVSVTAGTLVVLDSKTDDYSVADNDYGKIAAISGTVKSADGYIAIMEADGTSYHRVSLEITDMVLRSEDAGIYYNCSFSGDELVAAQVASYGVALSVKGTPEIGLSGTAYSVFNQFVTGSSTPSTLLKNVMKETNTSAQNNRNANLQIYSRAYMQIGDSYIYGETVSRSFREQVELADTIWSTLTAQQQTAILAMYRTFRETMETWTIPNIKNSI